MIEILSPAGDLERLKWAFRYGADAVYFGGKKFSLRANASNFDIPEIKEAVSFAHNLNKKIYVTINILFHNKDLEGLDEYLTELSNIGVDAFIVSDLAVIKRIKELNLKPEIHISTQESSTNKDTVKFWKDLGATRVVLARECSKEDIKDIKDNVDIELEVFVHGAMCVSYSGRCVLSNYVTLRDSNRGGCSQVCRFTFDMDESEYQIAAKDLSMVDYIEDLVKLNVSSLKIEGRMRSAYYIATVVDSYKSIIKEINEGTFTKETLNYYKKVLNRLSNRENAPQFFDKLPTKNEQYYIGREEASNQDFLGVVLDYKDGKALIEQRNIFKIGDEIEVFGPLKKGRHFYVETMKDTEGNDREVANHPQEKIWINTPYELEKFDMIRIPIK